MATIAYQGKRFALHEGETALDALLRNGVEVAYGCRSGICRGCMMRASSGTVPEAAQVGLRAIERRRGMLLTCLCRPTGELELEELGVAGTTAARIIEHTPLSDSVVRIRLAPAQPIRYEAGQYLALRRSDGLTRSYSLASRASEPWLELHVRRVPDGRMSRWLFDEARPGDELALRGPYGQCCYVGEELDAPLLLIAVGTGLAPLWGVVREALAAAHRGPITLVQAAAEPAGLYMRAELEALARAHPQLRLRSCVLRGATGELEQGSVDALAAAQLRESAQASGHLAFVCGDADIVQRVRRELFLAGLSIRRIFADAFV